MGNLHLESPMKIQLLIILVPLLIGTMLACYGQPITVNFDGKKLLFPVSIKEASTLYQLSFTPPGYYFRNDQNSKMVVYIDYHPEDYNNERQSKEALYDRQVVSYVFTYDTMSTSPDSIKRKVEQLCHCKLSFQADSLSADKDAGYSQKSALSKLLPQAGQHSYAIASISEDVVVGFREKPNYEGKTIPEVRFFYGQSPAQIRKGMMQY